MRRTTLGLVPNEGARQAWLALERLGWDQSKLRAEIQQQTGEKVSSGALVKYLYCDRRPGVPWAQLFERLLGVNPGDWYRGPVEPFGPPASKGAPDPEAKAS